MSKLALASAALAPRETAPETRPLTEVRTGMVFRIKRLSASPEVNQRLREMGCGEEQQAKLLSRHAQVICQVRHTRLGLSLKVARSIWVEPLPALQREKAHPPQAVTFPRRLLALLKRSPPRPAFP